MVSIKNYHVLKNEDEETYCVLVLEGDVELVRSKKSGRLYATAKRCRVPSTFDEETCKSLVGNVMPGRIKKVSSEPYEYEIPGTGETITLNYTYEYDSEDVVEPVLAND